MSPAVWVLKIPASAVVEPSLSESQQLSAENLLVQTVANGKKRRQEVRVLGYASRLLLLLV